MTRYSADIAAALRAVVDLIATGLAVPTSIDPGFVRVDLQFSGDETGAVDEWAAAMGTAAEVQPHVFANEGEVRSWQVYQATGALAGHPVRAWTARTVTR